MTNIRAVGCETAGYFQGLPEMNLKNINISNSNLEARKGINLIDADGVNFTNVTVKVEKGLPLTIYNGKNITLEGLSASSQSSKTKVKVMGAKTDKVVTKGI